MAKGCGTSSPIETTSRQPYAQNSKRQNAVVAESTTSKKQRTDTSSETEEEKASKEKVTEIEADASEDKGSRHSMEDAWVVLPDASLDYPGKLRCAHFAIYDGHGGRLAAQYAQKHLHKNVLLSGLPLGCESCKEGHT